MARKQLWFGTKEKMQWVKAPLGNMSNPLTGHSETVEFVNGGTYVRNSRAGSMNTSMSWNGNIEDLRFIDEYATGLHGQGFIYWADPHSMATNMFPPNWAAPRRCTQNWPNIATLSMSVSEITTPANSANLPPKGAKFQMGAAPLNAPTPQKILFVPLPPDREFRFGFKGTAVNTDVQYRVLNDDGTYGAWTTVTLLAPASDQLTNTTLAAGTRWGVEFAIVRTGSNASIDLYAATLREADAHVYGDFVDGTGKTGSEFDGLPSREISHVVRGGFVSKAATFKEVEAWQRM